MRLTITQGFDKIVLEVSDTLQATAIINRIVPTCKRETTLSLELVVAEGAGEEDEL